MHNSTPASASNTTVRSGRIGPDLPKLGSPQRPHGKHRPTHRTPKRNPAEVQQERRETPTPTHAWPF